MVGLRASFRIWDLGGLGVFGFTLGFLQIPSFAESCFACKTKMPKTLPPDVEITSFKAPMGRPRPYPKDRHTGIRRRSSTSTIRAGTFCETSRQANKTERKVGQKPSKPKTHCILSEQLHPRP